jgi:hypothetical protein
MMRIIELYFRPVAIMLGKPTPIPTGEVDEDGTRVSAWGKLASYARQGKSLELIPMLVKPAAELTDPARGQTEAAGCFRR